MTDPVVIRYDLDPTGANTNNLIEDEAHTLPATINRCFAPDYGAFYSESMVVTDVATGQPLTSEQFTCVELYGIPTALYGKEIMAIVLITDPTVSINVTTTYQVLGGEWGTSAKAIEQMYNALQHDDRPIGWPSIINKPDGFPPTQHQHDIGDLYGFEYVVDALERIVQAIEIGDSASHDQIYRYIDNIVLQQSNLTPQAVAVMIANSIASHLAANDPHPQYQTSTEVTAQINASLGALAGLDEQFFMAQI